MFENDGQNRLEMRIKNKELRQRRHRKEQMVKGILKAEKAMYEEKKKNAPIAEKPAPKPKVAPKKAAAPKAEAEKPAKRVAKTPKAESPAAE